MGFPRIAYKRKTDALAGNTLRKSWKRRSIEHLKTFNKWVIILTKLVLLGRTEKVQWPRGPSGGTVLAGNAVGECCSELTNCTHNGCHRLLLHHCQMTAVQKEAAGEPILILGTVGQVWTEWSLQHRQSHRVLNLLALVCQWPSRTVAGQKLSVKNETASLPLDPLIVMGERQARHKFQIPSEGPWLCTR